MKRDGFEEEMNDLVEDIMEYGDVAEHLEKDFKSLCIKRDSKIEAI